MPIVKNEDGTLRYKSAEYWIPKPWQGLTDDEVVACWARPDMFAIAHAIEAKLKELNT